MSDWPPLPSEGLLPWIEVSSDLFLKKAPTLLRLFLVELEPRMLPETRLFRPKAPPTPRPKPRPPRPYSLAYSAPLLRLCCDIFFFSCYASEVLLLSTIWWLKMLLTGSCRLVSAPHDSMLSSPITEQTDSFPCSFSDSGCDDVSILLCN